LVKVRDKVGNFIDLSYGKDGRLAKLVDSLTHCREGVGRFPAPSLRPGICGVYDLGGQSVLLASLNPLIIFHGYG
jgi:hypothetical protein